MQTDVVLDGLAEQLVARARSQGIALPGRVGYWPD